MRKSNHSRIIDAISDLHATGFFSISALWETNCFACNNKAMLLHLNSRSVKCIASGQAIQFIKRRSSTLWNPFAGH